MMDLMEPLEPRALFSAGLTGQYFDGSKFNTAKFSRTDPTINFDWGTNAPDKRVSAATFSVRWTGYVKPKYTQKYTFITTSNDGVRLWVGGQLIVDEFKDQSATWRGSIDLTAGKSYPIRIDYYQDHGKAAMKLNWSSSSTPQQIVPSSALSTSLTTTTTTTPPPTTTPPKTTPPATPPPVVTKPTPPPTPPAPPPTPPAPPPTPPPASVIYSGPIKITQGGTYSGNWESDDPNTPAVIVNTSDPVTINNANIRGRGTLIATWAANSNLTVENSTGVALNPNVAGKSPGRFLDDEHFSNIVVQNCSMTGTTGIYLDTYSGNRSSGQTIKILNNTALDIDGRHSDGNGGFANYETRTRLSDGHTDTGYDVVQFLQIAKATAVPGIVVSGNHIVNEPGKSRVEDTISVFLSSGTSSSPILIHDNYINGAYNIAPWQSNYSDDTYSYDFSYSGGGIMLGDGTPDGSTSACAYVQAYNNTVIDTTNYGIAITSGHDLQFYNNKIYSSGKLKDGRTITAQNVGAAIWNANGESSNSFYNDGGYDNQINWLNHGSRNDWWVPSADNWDGNVHSDQTWS